MIALSLKLIFTGKEIKMPRKTSASQQSISRYNNDCSAKGVAKNFIKIRKEATVEKPISTGSSIADKMLTKLPIIGKGIKYINLGSSLGAHTAHGINAYRESCGNRKKK